MKGGEGRASGKGLNSRYGGHWKLEKVFFNENVSTILQLVVVPGDLVMADQGFTIQESLFFRRAELAIPAFTKGKDQLDPVDVARTGGISNARIHVERVIGLVRRKFTILSGILPIDFLQCDPAVTKRLRFP